MKLNTYTIDEKYTNNIYLKKYFKIQEQSPLGNQNIFVVLNNIVHELLNRFPC